LIIKSLDDKIFPAMNERQRNNDQYEGMSPQELNTELREIYTLIPANPKPNLERDDTHISSTEYINLRRRARYRSDHKKSLQQSHSALVSRSHTTSFFQDIIIDRFSSEYDLGHSLEKAYPSVPYLIFTSKELLDLDELESPGIYVPEGAKGIERKAYRAQLSYHTFYRDSLTEQDRHACQLQLKQQAETIGEWLIQFLQKHRELP
jgi:hypothetical protein